MKYLPTIDLWNPAVSAALRSGQLKLQPGQWVKCGGDKPSRFAGCTPRTTVAAHPNGGTISRERFRSLRSYALSIGSR